MISLPIGIEVYIMECGSRTALMLHPALEWKLLDIIELRVTDDYRRMFGVSYAQSERDRKVTLVGQPNEGIGDDSFSDGDEHLIMRGIIQDILTVRRWSKALVEWSQSPTELPDIDNNHGYLDLGEIVSEYAQQAARHLVQRAPLLHIRKVDLCPPAEK